MPDVLDISAVHLEALDRGEAQLAHVLAVMANAESEADTRAAVAELAACRDEPRSAGGLPMTCMPGAVRFTRAEMFAGDGRGVFFGDPDDPRMPDLFFPSTPSPERFARCGQMEIPPMTEFVHMERAAAVARDKAVASGDPQSFARHYREECEIRGVDPDSRANRISPVTFGRRYAERRVPKPVCTQLPAAFAAVRDCLLAEGGSDRETLAVRFARGVESVRR